MKICIIGNAHVAALQAGWAQMRDAWPDTEIVFFAALGEALSRLTVEGDSLAASGAVCKQVQHVSGGLGRIRPADYDVCLVYGLGLALPSLENKLARAERHRQAHDAMVESLAMKLAGQVRSLWTGPLYLAPSPQKALLRADGDAYLDYAATFALAASVRHVAGTWLVPQPVETLGDGWSTREAYALDSPCLDVGLGGAERYPPGERRYMNAAYGEQWLAAFLELATDHADKRRMPERIIDPTAVTAALEKRNEAARSQREDFRMLPDREYGYVDATFHRYKNRFPYFGFINVEVGDVQALMFAANDDLIALHFFWYGPSSYEARSLDIWLERARRARVVFDIGSFSGLYSLVAAGAHPDNRVYAFEPVRRTHGRLLLNVQANLLTSRVTCVNLGISDRSGTAVIHQFREDNILGNGASIMKKSIDAKSSDEVINLISLDEFVQERGVAPELMKIDVEGAELLALDGMRETLARHRPDIIIEVTPDTAAAVVERLQGHGYSCRVIDDHGGGLVEFTGTVRGVTNLLAVPSA